MQAGLKRGVMLLTTAMCSAAAGAQEAPATGDGVQLETVVVTGTRAPGRTALASASPVEVISSERLIASGYADLGRALEFADPSINYPRPQTTASAANTRAVTLRGLSPDEVLVLVNGKRWHSSAVINVNFAVGRGTAPFDLSTIPVAAIERVEVLRDGAAAQYGSDAIAGVVNIILKSEDSGGIAQLQGGATEQGDGGNADASFSRGFALGEGGRISVSGEAAYQDPTDRSDVDQRYGRHTYRIGDPRAINLNGAASLRLPLGEAEFYDDLLLSRKDSRNAPNFRPPGTSPLYPDGFLPEVNPVIVDVGSNTGLRFDLPAGLRADVGNVFGYSGADFEVHHSANAALGLDSPVDFDAGSAKYLQDVIDLSLTRPLPELPAGGNLAFGAQFRYENYELVPGEAASILAKGAEGFPGFNPHVPVADSRRSHAAYADVELRPLQVLDVGGALRYDHYSDFGGKATWKTSLRLHPVEWVALRGSLGTGFRAPSLQQEHYNSISTIANGANKSFVNVGTFQASDPIAQALGASPLKPETSKDRSVGLVLTPLPRLSLTADWFRTDIDRRIALSDALSGAAVNAALAQAGISNVQQAAFFTNALDTRTQGYEISGKYSAELGAATRGSLRLAYQRSPTSIRSVAGNPLIPSLTLVGQHAQLLLAEAQPESKASLFAELVHDRWTLQLQATRFGEYTDAPIKDPQTFGAKTVVDLSVAAQLASGLDLTLGVLNVGDVYPDALEDPNKVSFATFGGAYVYGEEAPFGVAGRSGYARLRYVW
ncbi:MAG: TonB-dependent receptor [Hydrocarboniphaga sp.]|uniref:TonB-dependent receptor plug domain-containing protein n=1 Tax=Hydrocarboniphaga sp. TaxID=2033016 RepID=UPI00261BBD77|nr:TonB-dependent receptor [Hydrocarboniphaga sp.]MDB5968974.1 TonB-dependent receptor [Hydrocarboniphaga sp.]